MMMRSSFMGRFLPLVLFVSLLTLVTAAQAEQSVKVGDYVIHYNALATDLLTPAVAKAYKIPRSKNRAMLNVTVLRTSAENPTGVAVTADVSATATNLTGQLRNVPVQLIEEQDAKYYIGQVRVANQETLNFQISVTIDGLNDPVEVSFRQQFFTN